MTKERYDELKKQGGTIWHWEYGEISLEDTDICEESDLSGNHTGYSLIYFGEGYDVFLELKDLEEDATKGKWKHKTTSERTERFEPPMWEDIENEWDFYFAKGKETYHFWVEKDCVGISKCEYLCDYWSDAHKTLFEEEATKENYIKACEIVRDLFNKGDEK